jgi:glycosyltransferase involved in cell wall biosynthesis
MSYFANEQAVLYLHKKIMPLVWQSLPQVKLLIAGNGPTNTVKRLDDGYRIKVTGYVKNMCNAISSAKLAICPIISGAGIQNKILEAMAMAKPIVASRIAVKGLKQIKIGKHLLVADRPRDFAECITFLLRNPNISQRIGTAARKYVEINHNWPDKIKQLEQAYTQAMKLTRHSTKGIF